MLPSRSHASQICSRTCSTLKYNSEASTRKINTPGIVSIVGMPRQIGKASRTWNAAQNGDMRPRSRGQQHEQRNNHRQQHAFENPEQQHASQRHHRDTELETTHPPQMLECRDVEQTRTATSTIAASTTVGKLCSKPVKNSRQPPIASEAKTSDSGDFAPALSFTADCDSPPATGKPWTNAAAKLAARQASNS